MFLNIQDKVNSRQASLNTHWGEAVQVQREVVWPIVLAGKNLIIFRSLISWDIKGAMEGKVKATYASSVRNHSDAISISHSTWKSIRRARRGLSISVNIAVIPISIMPVFQLTEEKYIEAQRKIVKMKLWVYNLKWEKVKQTGMSLIKIFCLKLEGKVIKNKI